MRYPFGKIAIGCVLALALMGSAAYAQAPTPAAPKGSVVVASPTYTSIAMEITVNRPAAEVWKRIGKYCDVSEWLQVFPQPGIRRRGGGGETPNRAAAGAISAKGVYLRFKQGLR